MNPFVAIRSFFYSVIVNYSLYAFQETGADSAWLDQIFYKNDAYQAPVVITPLRRNGNIDMREENKFAITRLLGILFFSEDEIDTAEQSSFSGKKSIRQITENAIAEQVNYLFDQIPLGGQRIRIRKSDGISFTKS